MSVVGLEAHPRGHDLGSSHGPTRIIRRAIEEGPAYVPLVLDAFERWAQLEADAGRPIIDLVGAIRIGPPGAPLFDVFTASATEDLPFESLDAKALVERFPGFEVPDGYEAVYESGAGLLHAAAAVDAFQSRAARRGATLRFGEAALGWTATPDGVTVLTPTGTVSAGSLVLTAGAWTTRVAPTLGLPLVPHRVVNVSFTPLEPDLFVAGRLPAFIVADEQAGIYGVPVVPGEGLKVGASGTPTDPGASMTRHRRRDRRAARRRRSLPAKGIRPGRVDADLSVHRRPGRQLRDRPAPRTTQRLIASPCSGHGFKFASAVGPVLADLATGTTPRFDLAPFAIDRFAATLDPVPRCGTRPGGRGVSIPIGLNVAIGPDGPQRHEEIVAEVAEAAAAGLVNAWWPQLPPLDGVTPWDALTSIAATGAIVPTIGLGTSVVVSYAQHPLTLARQALTTQATVGGRLRLGLGTSHAPLVEQAYGLSFDRPARHLAEFLDVLLPALRGEAVDVHGDTVTAVGRIAIPAAAPPTVLLAALGPALLRLAGERTGGTIATWSGPRAIEEWVVPELQEAAAAAGRPAPQVVVNLPVSVTDDADAARRFVAERFGMAEQLPSYRRMLDREGVDGPADLAVVGNEAAVAAAIVRLADVGATEFLASTFGTPTDRARTLALLADLAG